jgi:hypothetical protein
MAGNPNVKGMVNDPDFLGLAPADQRMALSKLTGDDSFGSLSDGDMLQFVSKMTGGMNLRAPVPRPPVPQMQQSNLGIALGSGQNGIANPQQPAEQFAIQNPDQQGKLATAAGIGAAGSAGVATVPSMANAAARAAIPFVVKAGQMAAAHPMLTTILRETLKTALYGTAAGAGAKFAGKVIKSAP